jgi:hexosaminidase
MHYFYLVFFTFFFQSCRENSDISGPRHPHGIIPAPAVFQSSGEGKSNIRQLKICLPENFGPSGYLQQLSKAVEQLTWTMDCSSSNVKLVHEDSLLSESYRLAVEKDSVRISYADDRGLQYALTSLIQMAEFGEFPLRMCTIQDRPSFSYRGMHLDVARHFFSVEDVKKYLDFMAFYKFNHLHWHLTDDQGWRIEIKKYPKLTETGAWRKETLVGHYNDEPVRYDGQKYGGFYTQDEIREIVKYAADRNITVVPEIEMPGHALAALASYPELGCSGGPYEVATTWGVFTDVFCPTEATFTFLEGVIDEVVTLFPGKYIHIGGDECPKESWKKSAFCQQLIKSLGLRDEYALQSYFITRMEKYINTKGRQIIGWDEILEGGLAPNAIVMSWRGTEGGIEAAMTGHEAIMTPGSHCYFDYYQSESPEEPLAIGGFTSLEKVYGWNPVPESLKPEQRKYIIGGQANLWTEYIRTYSQVVYMAYARAIAMAEVLWGTNSNYQDFLDRFDIHHLYWQKTGANVAYHLLDLKPQFLSGDGKGVRVKFTTPEGTVINYVINGQEEKKANPGEEIIIDKSVNYTFQAKRGERTGRKISFNFDLHLGTQAIIKIDPPPSSKYFGNGTASLVNGVNGRNDSYSGVEWLGFEGTDAFITLDLQKNVTLNQVLLRFFKAEGQWIYLPPLIELYTSPDGVSFSKYTSISNIGAYEKIGDILFNLGGVSTRFLKIHAYNYGVIPDGRQGAGHRAWLFIDEIAVR